MAFKALVITALGLLLIASPMAWLGAVCVCAGMAGMAWALIRPLLR
jgi:hypothetical protein